MAELVSVFLNWTLVHIAIAQDNTLVLVVQLLRPRTCNKDVIVK